MARIRPSVTIYSNILNNYYYLTKFSVVFEGPASVWLDAVLSGGCSVTIDCRLIGITGCECSMAYKGPSRSFAGLTWWQNKEETYNFISDPEQELYPVTQRIMEKKIFLLTFKVHWCVQKIVFKELFATVMFFCLFVFKLVSVSNLIAKQH